MDQFAVESNKGRARLELKADTAGCFAVVLVDTGLSASGKVYYVGGGDGFDTFWVELAANWRGWTGAKEWRSLEGDLLLSARSSKTGHVSLAVTLAYGAPWTWRAEAILTVEAGQLERLASEALSFVRLLTAV